MDKLPKLPNCGKPTLLVSEENKEFEKEFLDNTSYHILPAPFFVIPAKTCFYLDLPSLKTP